jgi:ATP phosphoribosyltransferase
VTFLKPRSIPQLVAMGHLDAGLVGYDVLLDSIHAEQIEMIADTGMAPVKLMAAAINPNILKCPPARPLVVATEYPIIVDRWLTALGLAHVILHSHGSTEAFCPRFSDLVVDVVDTGETLRVNGLVPIHEFLTSTLVLVARKGEASPQVRTLADAIGAHS